MVYRKVFLKKYSVMNNTKPYVCLLYCLQSSNQKLENIKRVYTVGVT
jgi:hypothetical protein